jgi:diguanylate cyclase (GGDEF)-like protein
MGRKRIGIQTSRLEYGYGVDIWRGAVACAESLDADLIVFPGRNLEAPHGFDYQYNRIFHLMSRENLDALILVTTLISDYVDEDGLREFCSRFEGLPLVSIGIQVPGVPSIVVDNRAGVKEVIRHMVERHGARRVAFVRGPRSNWEANERFLAYKEELALLGLPFDESLVSQGDFTPHSVRPAVEALLESDREAPDAFVFANDEMAIKGMQILREKGFGIPGATGVAGFDDIVEASMQTTPLTTVRQPLFEMAWRAVVTASELIDGREAPDLTVLPTELEIRSSCGCLIRRVDDLRLLDRAACAGEVLHAGSAECLSLADAALTDETSPLRSRAERRKDSIRSVLDGLIGLLVAEADEGADGRFLSRYADILKEEIRAGADPGEWNCLLPVLSDAIERVFRQAIDARRLFLLERSCMALASEMAVLRQKELGYAADVENRALLEAQQGLSSIIQAESLTEVLAAQLPRLKIDTFFLSRFEQEWTHGPRSPWDIPEASRFVAGMVDGVGLPPPGDADSVFPSRLLFPRGLAGGERRMTLAVYPLFFRESHYGTIVYGMKSSSGFVYESLTAQISGIFKSIALFQAKERAEERLRRALFELKESNRQLSDLSLTDELTGLYNRRGFISLASQQLSLTRQMGKKALLIFGDLDGLKRINDNFGHGEGDFAIKAAGGILRRVFRTMDVIARMGGDEFTVFASDTNDKGISFFEKRVTELLAELNSASGKPYSLSISLGCSECEPDSAMSLEDHLRRADAMLYSRKIARKGPAPVR